MDPLNCLAIWFCSLQREHYNNMQGSWLTGHAVPAPSLGPSEQSVRAQVRHCSQALKVLGCSSKRCSGGKAVLLLAALLLHLAIPASSAPCSLQAASQLPHCRYLSVPARLPEAKKNATMNGNLICSVLVSRPARGGLVQTSKTRPAGTSLCT